MNGEKKHIEYFGVCIDEIPRNFKPLEPDVDISSVDIAGDKEIFLYLANLYHDRDRLLGLVSIDFGNSVRLNKSAFDGIKNRLSEFIDSRFLNFFASYAFAAHRGNFGEHIETSCMLANHYAELVCDPFQVRPSGMENRDIIASVIGAFDHFGRAFKAEYRPIMGYCGEKFTYLNSVVFTDMISIVNLAALSILKDDTIVRKCRNCGDYFIPASRSDETYCDKLLPNGKTCKTVGYDEKVKGDSILREYRKIYKTQNARKQRNSHKKDISGKFKNWAILAKEKVRECQTGKISIDEMIAIISSDTWMQ